MHRYFQLLPALALGLHLCFSPSVVLAQLDFEAEPINYHEASSRNVIEE